MRTQTKATISSNNQTETDESESWSAQGPADIKIKHSSGAEIEMVKGIVNGIGWGMIFPKSSNALNNNPGVYRIIDPLRQPLFKLLKPIKIMCLLRPR